MPTTGRPVRSPSVAIVGGGFGGVSVAVELVRAGFNDLVILEKADELGGVWRDNVYPGIACDIPSPLYSYSFATDRRWSRRYAPGAEILDYLKRTAARFGVDRFVRFGAEVVAADFDAGRARWRLRTAAGDTVEADVLVCAVGQLSRPVVPAIPGLDTFRGAAFHSARWDRTFRPAGRSVAVVGAGASAVQIVPGLQPDVGRLTVYHRSAPYVLPKPDRRYLGGPAGPARLAARAGFWTMFELFSAGLTGGMPRLSRMMTSVALGHLRRQVRDPELRRRLTPDYPMGCKRVLLSSTYYPALTRPDVEVVTEPITEITPTGIRAGGVDRPADAIVFATGFAATDFLAPMRITGLRGERLADTWADGARAYLGMAVPDFPNMFLMYGPNTNLGSGSIVYMLQRQARYITQAVGRLAAAGPGYLNVRPGVAAPFDAELRRRLAGTRWTGCGNWYTDAAGRITANWPGRTGEYARRTRRLVPDDYDLVTATERGEVPV
jgi:cation diffusion facilitator CzcD-associated flavoprotein CzcO